MSGIQLLQDIVIILLAGYMTIDQNGLVIMSWFPVIVGMISGLIMGDMHTGLIIGGTFQLMMLGVAALGGASAPNYGLATIVGVFVAVRTGAGIKAAIAVGLPVGLIAIQLEVLARIISNFLAHKMQTDNEAHQWHKMRREAWLGPILFSLQTALPTALVVLVGPQVVKFILAAVPKWVTNGLTIAGGMLPVVGIGMLMHYMPVKKFLPYIIVGFVLAAYLKIPVLGIALVGFAGAYWYFTSESRKADKAAAVTTTGAPTEEEDDDYDE
ncbi:PTS sugar transporter subunit IIC [Lactobacillus sp. CC-MHH1034]|uniref:PTS mannose/fructose/sorbose/N-acetylgalactosamine transporter subunit IIC n=1 Tax=Agrilactobacillus fermenti TaxID=2586909 RepID=UPI001E2E85BD|nr:PTS sugar transporter subunit IIC [Agrilactobacillus fermenti]MCD2256901.1 PTS sugar transporter subunit IIC [Agrilactobacillus fermenti]